MLLLKFQSQRIHRLWADCVRFHGKPCPLLALGVRVCDTALTKLELTDPAPDRLICVSEHDGCCVDAIQIGLHCTAGKKHLLYYKTGRLIFTVYDLVSGRSVRVCAKPEIAATVRSRRPQDILSAPEEHLFYFEQAHPLTHHTLEKVRKACGASPEDVPNRPAGVQDCPDQFQKFDLPDNVLGRPARRRR